MVTDIPKLPTDNLYKFIAMSGLVISISIVYFFFISFNKIDESISKTSYEYNLANVEMKLIESSVDALLQDTGATKSQVDMIKTNIQLYSASDIVNLDANLNGLSVRRNEVFSKIEELKIKSVELTNKVTEIKRNLGNVKKITFIGSIIFTIGTVMTYFGFNFWYKRIQIYQDKIIKKQAENT